MCVCYAVHPRASLGVHHSQFKTRTGFPLTIDEMEKQREAADSSNPHLCQVCDKLYLPSKNSVDQCRYHDGFLVKGDTVQQLRVTHYVVCHAEALTLTLT